MLGPAANQLRRNPLTGRWVTIASSRASRPQDFLTRRLEIEAQPGRRCPFCPGNEADTPPALGVYGSNGSWLVRAVLNLYPAFEGTDPMLVEESNPLHRQAPAGGLHEVLVLAPEHHGSLAKLDDARMAVVTEALCDRISAHARRREIAYTQAIVNYGREAGASLEHPHAQLLGIPFVPGEIDEEYRGFADHERDHGGRCLLCDTAQSELDDPVRVVGADDRCVVIAPWWSGVPYEMLLIPRHHATRITDSSVADRHAMGIGLRDALLRLHDVLGDVAYNVVVHTAPHSARGTYHWHMHLLPRTTTIAGFEQGTGVLINTVLPEVAADHLRDPSSITADRR